MIFRYAHGYLIQIFIRCFIHLRFADNKVNKITTMFIVNPFLEHFIIIIFHTIYLFHSDLRRYR